MSYQLRWYQHQAISAGVLYLTDPKRAGRNGLIVAPTGSGKSLLVAGIATGLDGPCIVFQPSKEILEQNAAKLRAYGYRPALFSASVGRKEIGEITLATIGSVVRRASEFAHFRYVLVDEAHFVNPKGGMYADFLRVLGQARVLGLTATPFRLHSNSFGSTLRFLTRTRPRIFQDVVHVTQVGDLARQGYLAPVDYRERGVIPRDRLKLNSTGADYTDASVQLAFRELGFAGRLQGEVQQLLQEGRKSVLVFTRFVEESRALAAAIPGAAIVTADTPDHERARILEDFKAGRVRVACNVGVLLTGFDFPALDTVVIARPTVSLSVYYQAVGRCIRPHWDKPRAVVVDLVGLTKQFGKVEDLMLQPGGRTGEQWVVTSRGRALTNVYFGDRDQAASPAASRRRYWAQRNGGGSQQRFSARTF